MARITKLQLIRTYNQISNRHWRKKLQFLDDNPRTLKIPEIVASSLFSFAYQGEYKLVEGLLLRGVDVNAIDPMYVYQGTRAICGASGNNHLDVARLLIEFGTDLNWSSQAHGLICPPLREPARLGYFEMVKLLVEAGGTLNEIDNNKLTVLDYALGNQNKEIAEYLIEQGALRAIDVKKRFPKGR